MQFRHRHLIYQYQVASRVTASHFQKNRRAFYKDPKTKFHQVKNKQTECKSFRPLVHTLAPQRPPQLFICSLAHHLAHHSTIKASTPTCFWFFKSVGFSLFLTKKTKNLFFLSSPLLSSFFSFSFSFSLTPIQKHA